MHKMFKWYVYTNWGLEAPVIVCSLRHNDYCLRIYIMFCHVIQGTHVPANPTPATTTPYEAVVVSRPAGSNVGAGGDPILPSGATSRPTAPASVGHEVAPPIARESIVCDMHSHNQQLRNSSPSLHQHLACRLMFGTLVSRN
jgi:hypothetical protein